jgi:hypothetical protein
MRNARQDRRCGRRMSNTLQRGPRVLEGSGGFWRVLEDSGVGTPPPSGRGYSRRSSPPPSGDASARKRGSAFHPAPAGRPAAPLPRSFTPPSRSDAVRFVSRAVTSFIREIPPPGRCQCRCRAHKKKPPAVSCRGFSRDCVRRSGSEVTLSAKLQFHRVLCLERQGR